MIILVYKFKVLDNLLFFLNDLDFSFLNSVNDFFEGLLLHLHLYCFLTFILGARVEVT